jgi:hypothetical protein
MLWAKIWLKCEKNIQVAAMWAHDYCVSQLMLLKT